MTRLSRRRFLGVTAGVVGSALALPRVAVGRDTPSRFDVAIVGGGMSGLFCAMRLKAAGLNVGLFEASDRFGGRVLSVLLPGFSEDVAEIGAMRLRTTDAVEIKLIDTLIGPDAKTDFDYPTHTWFLRGRLLHALNDPAKIPYGLDETEKAIVASGKNLLVETIRTLARSETTDRRSAIDQGVWEEILKIRSKEGRNFIVDSTGYNSLTFNWNVAAALPWFKEDFAPDTTYVTVKGGLQRLPDAMAAAYAKRGGLRYTNHPLRSIVRGNSGGMVLTFNTPDGKRTVSARRVILALTPAAIETLDPDSFILGDDRFRAALKGVTRLALGKIHLSFERAWWEQAGYRAGRTVTDIPLRQTYLWGKDAGSGKALALASYHDGPAVGFWQALATGESCGPAGWIDAARGYDGLPLPRSLAKSLPASRLMVEEAWYQLRKVHGIAGTVSPPIVGTYRNWGNDPLYGAGLHLWSIGTNAEQTMDYMREPFPGLHVCGEAWSRDQGWIKGATSTAEAVLQQKFGISPYVSG